MDFSLNDEQKMMIETVRRFIAEELQPLEDEVENQGFLDHAQAQAIHNKAKALGLYGMNMPIELGGGGLDRPYSGGGFDAKSGVIAFTRATTKTWSNNDGYRNGDIDGCGRARGRDDGSFGQFHLGQKASGAARGVG